MVCVHFVFYLPLLFWPFVLSVLYFLTDSSKEQVIKLYGITGSGSLAIVTFVIIFLDCCNDGEREEHEEEAIYRILQIKETKDKESAVRRNRRIAEEEEEKPKTIIAQHQQPQPAPIYLTPHYHHHYYPRPHFIHHIHTYSPPRHRHSSACAICRDSHASKYNRHDRIDKGIGTSDQFEPISRNKTPILKSIHEAQTESKLWDATHETQTSTTGWSYVSNNVSETTRETTPLKMPRSLLPTLEQSMELQDTDIAIAQTVEGVDSMTVTDV